MEGRLQGFLDLKDLLDIEMISQEEFNKNYDEYTQAELFSEFTTEQKNDLKDALYSIVAPKGKIYETDDLGDITKHTMQNLFDDFVKLSWDYFANSEEESSHRDTLNSALIVKIAAPQFSP